MISGAAPRCAPVVVLVAVGVGVVGEGEGDGGVVLGEGEGAGVVLVGVGLLVVGLAVGVGDFLAVFDVLGEATLVGIPPSWFPAAPEMAGAGVDPRLADRALPPWVEDALAPAEVEAEVAGCVTADGEEPLAFILTNSAPPPTRTSTATAAAAAIARPRPRAAKPDGDPCCTGKPSARKDFVRRMTRSR